MSEYSHIEGRTILVTGGGGSIGSEVVRTLLKFKPSRIIALDSYDGNLYRLRSSLSSNKVNYVIGDVRDPISINTVVRKYKPNYVFHCAAVKHIDFLEDKDNIYQALMINIYGTKVVLDACSENQSLLVNVSTDKAVYPTSILGYTKRCAELLLQRYVDNNFLKATSVRFGNVIDSIGSVGPAIREQIGHGGPILITDKRMKRYFITGSEATHLIIHAARHLGTAQHSKTYLLDMGKPVRIVDFASKLLEEITGLPLNLSEFGVRYTGIRKGEKLVEKLYYKEERVYEIEGEKLFRLNDFRFRKHIPLMDVLLNCITSGHVVQSTEVMKSIVGSEYDA